MRRWLAALLLVVTCSEVSVRGATIESCFQAKTNSERRERGIPVLRADSNLYRIADDHSDEMAAAGTIYHNDQITDERGVRPFAALGENVGMGSSCQAVQDAFMASPGHRANLLDRDYDYIGVGVASDGRYIYVTVVFWTPRQAATSPKPPRPRCTCPT